MLQLKDLEIGDQVLMPYYDERPFEVVEIDENSISQPVRVIWEDGSWTWAEQRHVCENTVKL